MIIKSLVVYESFKKFIIGRNSIIILFLLTIIFFISILLLPLFNHKGQIVGTVDLSKQLMMEEAQQEKEHHGN
jgi:hypothetical protein